MYKDIFGKTRQKINFHMHTTLSDGAKTPEEAAKRYLEEGYDAVAMTDHWVVGTDRTVSGLHVLSGVEYDVGGDPKTGVFHIVAIGMTSFPVLVPSPDLTPSKIVKAIHECGGFAVLGHPAWSMNSKEQVLSAEGIDATEIYNTVSDWGESYRADSSSIVDLLAVDGAYYPLFAVDDTHYYDGDECRSFVMVEAEDTKRETILSALRAGKFYSSQGPEIHVRLEGDRVILDCTPVSRINFHTNRPWRDGSVIRGEGLTHAENVITPEVTFMRASVEDAQGRKAWTNVFFKK